MRRKLLTGAAIALAGLVLFVAPAGAEEFFEELPAAEEDYDIPFGDLNLADQTKVLTDNLLVFLAGVFVFFMQAGFGMLEGGLTRAKNVANIMMKNLTDVAVGVTAFFIVGWSIAYSGSEALGGLFGLPGLGVPGILSDTLGVSVGSDGPEIYSLFTSTDFFFQAAFAATAATIVAGALAERTTFRGYAVFSVVITALIYPVVVRWTWGGGWLDQLDTPFEDFAGSTIVHSTGGWAALMGAIIVGPRIGKFGKDGKPRAIPGHSMALVVLGAFILFIGWFGFNPGSELAMTEAVPLLGVKTLMSAVTGAVAATILVWILDGKPDVSMGANGLLAGLVSITAAVGAVDVWESLLCGIVGGVIVVLSVKMFDRLKVDDPVGAISVHGVCGIWGTLAVGFFAADGGLFYGGGADLLITQIIAVVTVFVFVTVTSGLAFLAITHTIGLRVSEDVELAGLDVEEHGAAGYGPDLLNAGVAAAVPSEPAMSGGS